MAKSTKPKASVQMSFPVPNALALQIETERKNDRSGEPVKKAVFCRMLFRIGLASLKKKR